jgi:hypothetical protein
MFAGVWVIWVGIVCSLHFAQAGNGYVDVLFYVGDVNVLAHMVGEHAEGSEGAVRQRPIKLAQDVHATTVS